MSATTITSRADLSFTGCTAEEHPRFINWAPLRAPSQLNQWNIEYQLGAAMLEEVRTLHAADEGAAYEALAFAINDPNWKVCGHGAESGFAAALAALAVAGMRALQAGAKPFDPDALED